ncbi:hypothetical protein A1O1_07796 [Capronia coronata CBS 617.96]|uniref:ATP-grasp domain-containing protein n=1 Tax=Capronia coronata CBS 617.96 TaxID=1182541 RepID=W9XXM3_9EURO|nr:uncharacterized protein A1O1_07796 [Capronia coronata CBS 617.96]EXJ81731.1 hypothetical protein A1O1_07796 [Capronia coronata CBS 617.96]
MSTTEGLQYLLLVSCAASLLPLSTLFLLINYAYISSAPRNSARRHLISTPGFISRTILITGINSPQGLRLARAFHETGHNVVGADYEPGGLPMPARFSRSLRRFYRMDLQPEEKRVVSYIAALVQIITTERVDIWINCTRSADPFIEAQAREIIEQDTNCRSFGLSMADAPYFATRDAFLMHTKSLGLPVLETYLVRSRDEVHRVLHNSQRRRRYLLQSLNPDGIPAESSRTMLPRKTPSQTYNTVARIPIQKAKPWRLEQITEGLKRYSSFAIIVERNVMAFVASYPTGTGGAQVLDSKSALNQSMLMFMQTFASKQRPGFSAHLGVDFCVEEHANVSGVLENIFPVSVSVHAQAGLLFFQGAAGSAQLTRAYLASLPSRAKDDGDQQLGSITVVKQDSSNAEVAMPSANTSGIYCFGQELLQLCLTPLLGVLTREKSLIEWFGTLQLFLRHLLFCRDNEYSFEDPVPFWWAYQVYIPLQLLMTLYMSIRGSSHAWPHDPVEVCPPQQLDDGRSHSGIQPTNLILGLTNGVEKRSSYPRYADPQTQLARDYLSGEI